MSMTLTSEVLRKYPNPVFFETGTNKGGGIAIALAAGFTKIYSVEWDAALARNAHGRFEGNPMVRIFCGDSADIIAQLLPTISDNITFWLDAHDIDGGKTPLLREIDAIASCQNKNHTIMIDDWMVLDSWGLTSARVKEKVMTINPAYRCIEEDNSICRMGIMVFKV